MNRKIDDLGRIVIPKEMRTKLDIKDGDSINIEVIDDKIVISNPNEIDYKKRIEKAIELCNRFIATNEKPCCNLGDLQLIIETLTDE